VLLLCLLPLTGACQRETATAPPVVGRNEPREAAPVAELFEDRTPGSGVQHTYGNGEEAGHYAILESLGGGVALIDFDGDGLLDLFVTGGGYFDGPEKNQVKPHPCRFYRNRGGWKFEDVTARVGLDRIPFYSHGAAVADYDNDGWPDLLVTGYGRLALFHNEPDGKGGRRFVEVTKAAGLERDHFWSTSAGWADLDGDGFPELYVCQYVNWSMTNNPRCGGYTADVDRDVCPPRQFESVPHALYHNVAGPDGTRRFRDVTAEAGLRVRERPDKDYGKGLGVVLVDVNLDGKPDIYVANDTTDNFLYLNASTPGKLHFKDVGFELGVARDGGGVPNGSMGVDAADYDRSGAPSLWVTNYEGELHALYHNVLRGGQQFFQYSTQVSGIGAIGQRFVGFGTAFVDLDNDGWEDLVISNGHVIRHPRNATLKQRPVLFRNLGNGRFTQLGARPDGYFGGEHIGRGLAVGDLDNDGRVDLVISHLNEPVVLLRNVSGGDGPRPHWLGIELRGRDRRDVVGAKLVLEVNGQRLTRFAKGGGSYLSSGDRRIVFGLGQATSVGRLSVTWPSGEPREQHWDGLATDRYWRVAQGLVEPQSATDPGIRP
jgi:hypothetical protein